jgi:hypothetical protein
VRVPPAALSLCGDSSREEREDASLEIRVRFPVAAPAECRWGLPWSIGFESRRGRASVRCISTNLVGAAVFPERGRLPCKEDVAGATPAGGSEANVASYCGVEQEQLAWLITKRSRVRVTPPQPLRSSEEGGPHKPDRDGSTPSAATIRSRLAVGRAALNCETKVRFLPPEPPRGERSGDRTCSTSRPRRVRSSRPAPHADVAQQGEAARSDRARCPFESDRRYHVTVVEQEYTAG